MRDRSLDYYSRFFATMEILPEWYGRVEQAASLIRASWDAYQAFLAPAALIGAIHHMECACDFTRHVINGQRWDRATTIEPIGLGPFTSWRDSTIFALRRQRLCTLQDAEAWNGWGYAMRGLNSPYIWSGSNHGLGIGKFIRDGQYDPHAVSAQVGVAPILWFLREHLGPVTHLEGPVTPASQ